MKKKIALIYGGEGAEHGISLRSAEGLRSLIDEEKYELYDVLITKEGEWLISVGESRVPTYPVLFGGVSGFLTSDGILRVDAALPVLHGEWGEDGKIQGALDTAHIRYVGCGTLAGAVSSDKILTRAVADSLGIPGAKWIYTVYGDPTESIIAECERRLSYPVFVKPSGLGSSIGASAARNRRELAEALSKARSSSHDGRVLIEELIEAECEIECAYIGGAHPRFSASGVIDTKGRTYGFCEKYSPNTDIKASHGAHLDENIKALAESYARTLTRALSISDMARIDFFLTREGKLYFNEINTIPGMTSTSLYPLLCEDAGLARGEFINRLLLNHTGK